MAKLAMTASHSTRVKAIRFRVVGKRVEIASSAIGKPFRPQLSLNNMGSITRSGFAGQNPTQILYSVKTGTAL